MDEQTLSGKVVKGVADLSRKHKKPLIVVVGRNELSLSKTTLLGVHRVVTLMNAETLEQDAFRNTHALIKKRMREEVIPFFL